MLLLCKLKISLSAFKRSTVQTKGVLGSPVPEAMTLANTCII